MTCTYRLQQHADMAVAAVSEKMLLRIYVGDISVTESGTSSEDDIAVKILQAFQPATLTQYSPRAVCGDGNCCYRAVSLALFGTQQHHLHVRLLTAIEMMLYPMYYDIRAADYAGNLASSLVDSSSYSQLMTDVLTPGGYAELMHIYAISTAMGRPKAFNYY